MRAISFRTIALPQCPSYVLPHLPTLPSFPPWPLSTRAASSRAPSHSTPATPLLRLQRLAVANNSRSLHSVAPCQALLFASATPSLSRAPRQHGFFALYVYPASRQPLKLLPSPGDSCPFPSPLLELRTVYQYIAVPPYWTYGAAHVAAPHGCSKSRTPPMLHGPAGFTMEDLQPGCTAVLPMPYTACAPTTPLACPTQVVSCRPSINPQRSTPQTPRPN